MKIEDLKKMSRKELEKARVVVITECPNCPSYHGTFADANCGRNNEIIRELDNGFSPNCKLFNVEQFIKIWQSKRMQCNCERCRDGRTQKESSILTRCCE